MREATAVAEKELGKILTKPQKERIAQIQLQQQGDFAVTTPEMQQKLNMSPDQIEQINAIMDQSNQARREMMTGPNSMFSMFSSPTGGFDRAAMQSKMQDPKFREQMDKAREKSQQQRDVLQNQTLQQIGRLLTKKQKANFAKMKGPPFDLAKLDRNYDPNAAANADTKADSTSKGANRTAATAAPAKSEAAAKPSSTTASSSGTSSSSSAAKGAIKSNAKGSIKSNTKGITRSVR